MERSLASILLVVAGVALSIAAGGWWLQRIVFTPNDSRDTTAVILEDPDIRSDLTALISAYASPPTGRSSTEIAMLLESQVLTTRAGAATIGPTMKQIHERVIGINDEPIEMTGVQMIEVVRDQRAADARTLELPVPTLSTLNRTRVVLRWLNIAAAVIGVLTLIAGIVFRPTRREFLRAMSESLLALAISMVTFGYLIPVQLFPAIDNSTWISIATRLSLAKLPTVIAITGGSLVLAAATFLLSMTGGRRRTWSTPVSASRYQSTPRRGW